MDLKTVKMNLMVIMLCSGFAHSIFTNRLRIVNINPLTNLTWNQSQEHCEKNDQSLLTLYDEGDRTFLNNFLGPYNLDMGPYVGLKKSNQTSRWSDGTPYKSIQSKVSITAGELVCEGMEDNKWKRFNCSDRKYFMCYQDNNYTLIDINKTWCQAQLHCRKYYTDLVSISNDTQNGEVIQGGQNKTFWIGLMHNEGEWVDKSCSTYRHEIKFEEGPPPQFCSAFKMEGSLQRVECDISQEPTPSVCSKGRVRIITISESLTWEEAFDYCKEKHSGLLQIEDHEDQEAVEQWLKNTDSSSDLFWIALRQSRVFGFWIWRDRTVSSNNWKDGNIPEMPLSNNCGAINSTDFMWRDENCWHKLPFLCEEEISFPKEQSHSKS